MRLSTYYHDQQDSQICHHFYDLKNDFHKYLCEEYENILTLKTHFSKARKILNEHFKDKKYAINSSKFISSDKTIEYYLDLIKKYPIKSIEDPFFEDDWDSWVNFTIVINKDVQLVGDD